MQIVLFDLSGRGVLVFFCMRKTLFVLVLLSAVGLLAYSNSFSVPFQFDGLGQIAGNPMIKNMENFAPALEGHALHSPPGSVYNNRRLVGYLTLALNYHFGGPDVTGYHFVNLAIHVINGILVYFLVILTFETPYFKEHSAKSIEHGATNEDQRPKLLPPTSNLQPDAGDQQSPVNVQPSAMGAAYESRVPDPGLRPFAHDSRFLVALFAALLFVVHPVQTQAVTYIVQRFTSLAAMFYLLSIVFYIKGRQGARGEGRKNLSAGEQASNGSRFTIQLPIAYRLLPIAYYFLCLFFAVLAMLTKEIAFTLPVVIVLYEFFFFKSPLKKKLLFLVPVLLTLVIIPISVMGTHKPLGELLSDLSARTRVQTNIPRWDYLMTQMRVITTYIRLLFLPVNQNLDYSYPIYHSLFDLPVLLATLFLLSLAGLAGYLLWKSKGHSAKGIAHRVRDKDPVMVGGGKSNTQDTGDPEPSVLRSVPHAGCFGHHAPCSMLYAPYLRLISFGIFWFFITLSVESSVIPIADVIFEHRVYLPSVGAFIAISAAAFMIVEKAGSPGRTGRVMISVLSAVVIVLLAGATYARNTVWRDPVGLWQDVLRKSPGNARAYNDLGYLYLTRGQTEKSIGYFRSALRIRPYYSNAHTNLGVAYYAMGWTDAAIGQFKKALALEPYGPDVAEDHHNLGIAFTRKGMLDEAISEYLAALKLAPGDAGIYSDMGVAYRQKGLTGKAIECFRKALDLDPGYVYAHLNLAEAYKSEGRHDEARKEYDMARRLERAKGDSPF
jgi:protein O-mannosyl-transferase